MPQIPCRCLVQTARHLNKVQLSNRPLQHRFLTTSRIRFVDNNNREKSNPLSEESDPIHLPPPPTTTNSTSTSTSIHEYQQQQQQNEETSKEQDSGVLLKKEYDDLEKKNEAEQSLQSNSLPSFDHSSQQQFSESFDYSLKDSSFSEEAKQQEGSETAPQNPSAEIELEKTAQTSESPPFEPSSSNNPASTTTSSSSRTTGPTPPFNQVGHNNSYEKIFNTTQARYKEALENFQKVAKERAASLYSTANERLAQLGIYDRFSEVSGRFNEVTGYSNVEHLKSQVVERETALLEARARAKEAKTQYEQAVENKIVSQRDVNELLQRKAAWTDVDVKRFPELVRQDHINETEEKDKKAAFEKEEGNVEKRFSELMRTILSRYHEEQIWSDKVRSLSTYGTIAITATNVIIFLLALVIVEPWKRKRLLERLEDRMQNREAETASRVESVLDSLEKRIDSIFATIESNNNEMIQREEQREQLILASAAISPDTKATTATPDEAELESHPSKEQPSEGLNAAQEQEQTQTQTQTQTQKRETILSESIIDKINQIKQDATQEEAIAAATAGGAVLGGLMVAIINYVLG